MTDMIDDNLLSIGPNIRTTCIKCGSIHFIHFSTVCDPGSDLDIWQKEYRRNFICPKCQFGE